MKSTYFNKNVRVSDDDEQGFGPSDGHIEALGVGQKAQNVL